MVNINEINIAVQIIGFSENKTGEKGDMTYPNCKEVAENSLSSEAQLKRGFDPLMEIAVSKELNSRKCVFVLFCISSSCLQLNTKDEQEERYSQDIQN